jgi:hypothetical protein
MAYVWIYPHVPKYAGKLGIVHFRMNLEARLRSEPDWNRDWRTNTQGAKTGDTVIFAFKEGDEWFVVGDAVVSRVDEPEDSDWKFSPRYEAFRLYPRNIAYAELRQKLMAFNPDQHQRVKLTADDYVTLLGLTVIPS